jgi:hypothetical protein
MLTDVGHWTIQCDLQAQRRSMLSIFRVSVSVMVITSEFETLC